MTIRLRRSRMNRVSTEKEPCKSEREYSKGMCLTKCVVEKCIGVHRNCDLFSLWSRVQEKDFKRNLTGFDMDFCYMLTLYASGVDPFSMLLFRVNDLSVLYSLTIE